MASAFQGQAAPKTLADGERDAALQEFLSGTGWYRTSAVDELSAEEANIVATRWVGKISGIIPLPEKLRDSLHCTLSEGMRRRFVNN